MRTGSLRAGFRTPLAVILTLIAGLMLGVSPALAADRWKDITDAAWIADYGVTAAEVDGVADGFLDGTFQPHTPVTRGQFTKMAVNGLGVETLNPPVPRFKDVPRSNTFYVHIEGAAEARLVGGYDDGSFLPGQLVSRQQSNTILARYLSGAELSTAGFIRGVVRTYPTLSAWFAGEGGFYLAGFTDQGQLLEAHRPGTAYLVYRVVVMGSGGRLNPTASLTRAQAAALVLRTADTLDDIITPPTAPTGLATLPVSPSQDGRPYVNGKTIPGGKVALYDVFGGATTELVQTVADSAGNFSARVPQLFEGAHSFTAKVKDELGLVSVASGAVAYVLDITAPDGSILSPAADSAGRSRKPSFTASATDTGSGVESVAFQYRPAGSTGAYTTISTDTTETAGIYEAVWGDVSLPDGAFDFKVVVTDVAQNQNTLGPISVIVDLQIPTVELLAPIDAGIVFTINRTPVFAATAADAPSTPSTVASGVVRVDFLYALRSALPAEPASWTAAAFTLIGSDDSPGYMADWGTRSLADGDYIFAVQSSDKAGNSSALDWQRVVVDNLAPVVSITAPLTGVKVKGGAAYSITWTATDTYFPTLPIKIEYSADNGATWPTMVIAATENDGTFSWTTVPVVDITTAKIRVTATDGMARPTPVISGAFTIDSTAPPAPTGVAVSDADVNPGIDGRDFTATWTVSASTDAVKQHVYILPSLTALVLSGAGAHTPLATLLNNTTATWQGTIAMSADSAAAAFDPLKAYQVWIVAEDAVGNLTSSAPAAWPADPPAAPTGVDAGDNDTTAGLDRRDFEVWWTKSISTDVLSHRIYMLPSATTLVLTGTTPHTPVATVTDDTVPWVGPASPATDSSGAPLAAVPYRVYVVATDDDGRTAATSALMTPVSD